MSGSIHVPVQVFTINDNDKKMMAMANPPPIVKDGSDPATRTTMTTTTTTSSSSSSATVVASPSDEERPQKRQCTIPKDRPYFPILDNVNDGDDIVALLSRTYKKYQAVFLPRFLHDRIQQQQQQQQQQSQSSSNSKESSSSSSPSSISKFNWRDIGDIFNHLDKTDQESFCIENDGSNSIGVSSTTVATMANNKDDVYNDNSNNNSSNNNSNSNMKVTPSSAISTSASTFLRPEITNEVAYCSFLVQHDNESFTDLLERLPVKELNTPTRQRQRNKPQIACTTTTETTTTTTYDDEKHDTNPPLENNDDVEEKEDDINNREEVTTTWEYEPCIWIFFGRNNRGNNNCNNSANRTTSDMASPTTTQDDLQGRPEHTDSISHDGTWHYQLYGTKRWVLRPTKLLLQHFQTVMTDNEAEGWMRPPRLIDSCITDKDVVTTTTTTAPSSNGDNDDDKDGTRNNNIREGHRLQIDCNEGDVLIINTRLWFHQTILPPQPEPSVSYARDFWINKPPSACSDGTDSMYTTINGVRPKSSSSSSPSPPSHRMTNLDGLYATDNIEPGTVIFTETEMPDCELHRSSTDPNCEIVELDGGIHAIVSCRTIRAGEFFCVAESDDDDDEEGNGDENDREDVDEDDDEEGGGEGGDEEEGDNGDDDGDEEGDE